MRALGASLGEADHDRDDSARDGERARAGEYAPLSRSDRHEGQVERWILPQDRLLELAQLLARLDAELLDESPAGIRVGAEGLGLPSRPVERQHQLPAKAFPQRMFRDQRLELRHECVVASQRKLRVETFLDRDEPQLIEAVDLGLRELLVAELTQRVSAPERERAFDRRERLGRLAVRVFASAFVEELLEAADVDLLGVGLEDVPAGPGGERLVRFERLPQPRDLDVEAVVGPRRRPTRPKCLDQALARDDLVRVHHEERQEGARLGTAQWERSAVANGLHRPE